MTDEKSAPRPCQAWWDWYLSSPIDYRKVYGDPSVWTEQDTQVFQQAQPAQEPVAWMNNKDFEPIRVRIMQEAYELADRNDSESYNAIKVMCGDVQRMLPPKRPWVGLTDEEIEQMGLSNYIKVIRETEAKLKEKNT
jgi:hypothetical protein